MHQLKIASCSTIFLSVLLFIVLQECVGPRVCTLSAGCYNGTFKISRPSFDLFEAFLGMPYAQKVKRFEVSISLFIGVNFIVGNRSDSKINIEYL